MASLYPRQSGDESVALAIRAVLAFGDLRKLLLQGKRCLFPVLNLSVIILVFRAREHYAALRAETLNLDDVILARTRSGSVPE
jgi:hypothetical protein